MNYLVIAALALAPVIAIIAWVYWKDHWEKEPIKRLLLCFMAGIFSCLPIVLMELFFDVIFKPREGGIIGNALAAFVFVGLTEEFWKWLFVYLTAYRSKDFNEPYDGITYSVMVSLGFAAVENVLYVAQGGVPVAVLRMFTAVPAHTIFAIIMGFYLGLAKCRPERRKMYMFLSLLLPVLAHGAYDFALFIPNPTFAWTGAGISLVLGVWFSIRAIRMHNRISPFRKEV